MKLIPQLTTKTKEAKPCKECTKNIEIGEKYFSVTYNDGFVKKLFGAFHKNCWVKFEKNN